MVPQARLDVILRRSASGSGGVLRLTPLLAVYALLLILLPVSGASAQDLIMRRENSVGNWRAEINNNGILFNETDSVHAFNDGAGGFWRAPDGSWDTVVFSAGLWFGGYRNRGGVRKPHVEYTYEPNHVGGHFVPGSLIYDGDPIDTTKAARDKYRVYRSTDLVGPEWPLRTTSGESAYVDDPAARASAGPKNVYGDQDLFIVCKDSDPGFSGDTNLDPFRLDVRTRISFWRSGFVANVAVVQNEIVYRGADTVYDPVVALALDGDIQSPQDDRLKAVRSERTQAAVFFTDRSTTDPMLGALLLAGQHTRSSFRAGLTSLRYWDIEEDPISDSEKYLFLTEPVMDTAISRIGDARVLMSSLSHTPLAPGDTLFFAYAFYVEPASITGALSRTDSAAMLGDAETILDHYQLGNLGALGVRSAPVPGPSSLRLYPVPADDLLRVEFPNAASIGETKGARDVRILDLLGREVARVVIPQNGEAEIDTRALPEGVYVIASGTSRAKLVIRRH